MGISFLKSKTLSKVACDIISTAINVHVFVMAIPCLIVSLSYLRDAAQKETEEEAHNIVFFLLSVFSFAVNLGFCFLIFVSSVTINTKQALSRSNNFTIGTMTVHKLALIFIVSLEVINNSDEQEKYIWAQIFVDLVFSGLTIYFLLYQPCFYLKSTRIITIASSSITLLISIENLAFQITK